MGVLTPKCPKCGLPVVMHHVKRRKQLPCPSIRQLTTAEIRMIVNEFTEDDPPPYG